MGIEESIKTRIGLLLAQSGSLAAGDEHGQATSERQVQECAGWLVSAQNALHLVCNSPTMPYRAKADALLARQHGWVINEAVGEMAAVLRALLIDADAGLLASVADQARAETFDDFLDHADSYLKDARKNEAGVIAGVVFEDTSRRLCRKHGIVEKGVKLDTLISELSSCGELSAVQAKRASASWIALTYSSKAMCCARWGSFNSAIQRRCASVLAVFLL